MKSFQILYCFFFIIIALTLKQQQPHFNVFSNDIDNDSPQMRIISEDESITPNRQLLTITRNSIRITLDTSTFNTITAGTSGTGTTTATNLAFILKTMKVAVNFYMTRLKVYPLSSLIAPGLCVDYIPSNSDQTFGIGASDLHIYVFYKTDQTLTYGATGKSCWWYGTSSSLPDSTLQTGRPIMGRIIFNTYNLVDQQTTLTNFLFQSITSTALHETLHILGFDSTLYSTWLISNSSSPSYGYNYTAPLVAGTVSASRPATNFLTTPYVTAWAQNFFGCASLIGMILQNQDSTGLGGGSHWQRCAMYDELMTATSMGSTSKYFSGLSFAVLMDMGWYTVDNTFNDVSNYGYQQGCSFVLDACYSTTSFIEFCNAATTSSISSCQSDYLGKATCTNIAATMADGCGIEVPYSNCVDPSTTDNGYVSYTDEAFSTTSFCVSSSLGIISLPNTLTSRCYPYVCGSSSITFTISIYSITCQSTEAGVQKTLSAMTGTLTCPNFFDFCSQTRKTCPNWCSSNGYCMGGICNCLNGYFGNDCSKTQCSTGTYYNPAASTCVSVCPSGYYQNIYDHSCEPCASTCQQCYGQPTICIGCISTASNPQYFYNGSCYSACPSGTYTSGFNCSACDPTVFCATCSLAATNCTSCLFDSVNNQTKFLNQPIYGTCINSCPATGLYPIADVANQICVNVCADNLILLNNTCTFCQNNTFKLISNSSCVPNCPNFYYPNSITFICAQCDSSCQTCSGPYAQNCTTCSPTATLRYWLLEMCWSGCPGGYYPNNTDDTCHICPATQNCANCTYSNSSNQVLCTSCVYGYFLQSSSSLCVSSCSSIQYSNKGNNSCISCNSACVSCTGPSNSSCTSCIPGQMLIQNVTGGFCVNSCGVIGYTVSGSNCLSCDSSCYTCFGTGNSECTSCFNGTYLNQNYCTLVCPPASYPNSTGNICSSCSSSCTFCFGATVDNCTGCISGMVLFNFTCTSSCPSPYTVNQWNVCYQSYLYLFLSLWTLLLLI